MIISNFHVQQVLKTYSQQLSSRSRSSKERIHKESGQKDEVSLSTESKKMLLVDRIVNETLSRLSNGEDRNETGQAILDQLSREYGRPLDVDSEEGSGMAFKVMNESRRGVVEHLSGRENEELRKRLFDIAHSFVYSQLM
jgi:hypothetical protein